MMIRIGTRGSRLALAQARMIASRLAALGHEPVETIIETRGDRDQTSSFPEFGGPGVFVREIESRLLAGDIDLAVHSYKDLPTATPDELVVGAVPERLDPADRLLIRREALAPESERLPLRQGARVGTSSSRRQALLLDARHDLHIEPLRGNVDTRLRKLREGLYDAIVLAGAGLARLNGSGDGTGAVETELHVERLAPEWFVPAPAQGALALQVRAADDDLLAALQPIHQEAVARPLVAERTLLARVEGSCELPFGAWCTAYGGRYRLVFALGDGQRLLRGQVQGAEPEALAERAWERLEASDVVMR